MSTDPLLVFDRATLRQRRERAARRWDGHAFLKREIATRLVERLGDVRRSFGLALDLGCHGDEVARALSGRTTVQTLRKDKRERTKEKKETGRELYFRPVRLFSFFFPLLSYPP